MVNYLARLVVTDNTGVRLVQCINLIEKSKYNFSNIGSLIVVVIKRVFTWSRFKKGLVMRGLIVRCCTEFMRGVGVWMRFGHNAVVLVNKKKAPLAKRLKGPFTKELCIRYNLLGTVTRFLV